MSVHLLTRYGLTTGPAAPAPFSPSDIDGLRLWLDAADESTIEDTAGAVSKWTSKDVNAREFSQATAASQPMYGTASRNGRRVVDFDDDFLVSDDLASVWKFLHDGTKYSMFVVFKPGYSANPNAFYGIMGTNAADPARVGVAIGYGDRTSQTEMDAVYCRLTDGSGDATGQVVQYTSPAITPAGDYHILETHLDPGNATVADRFASLGNGVEDSGAGNPQSGTPSAADPTGTLAIGGLFEDYSLAFRGQIAELLIYEADLSAGDRTLVREYLAEKWGVSLTAGVPATIPGLKLWLDAADSRTITHTAGAVTQWKSKDATERTFSQATGTLQPTYRSGQQAGRRVVSFAEDYLESDEAASVWKFMSDGTKWSSFIVMKPGASDAFDTITRVFGTVAGMADIGAQALWFPTNNRMRHGVFAGVLGGTVGFAVVDNATRPNRLFLAEAHADPANATFADKFEPIVNEWAVGTTEDLTLTRESVSASDPTYTMRLGDDHSDNLLFQGHIAEWIVYEGELTLAQRDAVRQYLIDKWGLRPATHQNLDVWLDAQDPDHFTLVTNAVSQWRSRDLGKKVFSQGTTARRPVYNLTYRNGVKTVDFINDYLTSDLAASAWTWMHDGTKFTAFAAVTPKAVSFNPIYAGTVDPNNRGALLAFNAAGMDVRVHNGSSATVVVNQGGPTTSLNTWVVASHLADYGNATLANRARNAFNLNTPAGNNTQSGTPTGTAPTYTLGIGNSDTTTYTATMELAELVIVRAELTTAQRKAIIEYLMTKWGIL